MLHTQDGFSLAQNAQPSVVTIFNLLSHSTGNITVIKYVNTYIHRQIKLLLLSAFLVATVIIRSPVNQSACAGGTVNFTCVVMFTSGPLGPAGWFTNDGDNDATAEPDHTRSDDSNRRSAPTNVTTVLTVTNVSISDNGADYICAQGFNARSDTVFLSVFGKLTTDCAVTIYTAVYKCINICTVADLGGIPRVPWNPFGFSCDRNEN